ncbi:cyclic diguanylate phosphodiesterase [Pseudonocardia sulfidoxydans NBRC 16205]|uniref:Cyclic diguanylate phosphodiesterase n=2 Tax=Pseudonocardia sulfidoxydans TaxID=54011 RepID=A0A511DQ13_9PSEU|nr:GAF domain-containing SpoIIE family protein phosphatase [Pseudonocardia sulfidoxydans]GEL25834.1 cyclic diguanylate phosphodiesterase [Pseudonocardia sulfidoxydans NBRC 16205]
MVDDAVVPTVEHRRPLPGTSPTGATGATQVAHPDIADALTTLIERALDLLQADTAAVLLTDPSGRSLVASAARGITGEVQQGVRIPIGRGFAGTVAAQRRVIAVEHVDSGTVLNPLLRHAGIRSLLGAPLMVDGEVIGVLHVGSLTTRRFRDVDHEMLQLIADRAALAIQAELTRAQRNAAAVLQNWMVPEQPTPVPDLDVAARYVAGDQLGIVGGDWYDVLEMPSGRVLMVVGDVLGHGLRAAQTMTQLRTVLRTHALTVDDPARLVDQLDRYARTYHPGIMATVWCAVLSPDDGRLEMSSAGHPVPLLALPGRAPDVVAVPPDLPVGVTMPGATRRVTSVEFPAGALICAYSDGLVERRGLDPDVGLDNLTLALRDATSADGAHGREVPSVETICAEIMATVVGGTPVGDDIALLVARRRP